MPDQFSPAGKNTQSEPEFSLSDFLPDLLDEPVNSARPMPPPVSFVPPSVPPSFEPTPARLDTPKEIKPVGLGGLKPLLLVGAGLLLFPLLLVGIFLLIINSQSLPSSDELARAAQTPVATVFSISQPPTTKAPTPLPAACTNGGGSAFGPFDPYPCARQTTSPANWDAFFTLADQQLSQNGVRLVGTERRYDVVNDRPDQILAFYAKSLRPKGYGSSRPQATGSTPIGDYRVDYYVKGTQQLQVLALTLNRNSPDDSAHAGEIVIRFNATGL